MSRYAENPRKADRACVMKQMAYLMLPLIASCYAGGDHGRMARPGGNTEEICRYHDGVSAKDVFGNEMYVRCNDGAIFTT